jgi:hypothetical protein
MTNPSLQEVVGRHQQSVMKLPSVTGIAGGVSPTTAGKKCILVYVADSSVWPAGLPKQLEGYDVELVGGGGFRAL